MENYVDLLKEDWIQYFEEEMNLGKVKIDASGRFYGVQILSKNNPWVFNKCLSVDKPMNICNQAHDYFNRQMNFIHSYCHRCYKVVVMPTTVKQLFQLCDLQKEIDIPAKCGIEVRNYVPRLYGGYFYNRGVENGRDCYKRIKKLVHEQISPDITVILKRGCTEFEMKYGPSDQWKLVDGQEAREKRFAELYHEEISPKVPNPEYLIAYKKRTWLHWASDHFDETVLEFTGGQWLQQGVYYREFMKPYLFPQNKYVMYQEDGDD